jgi:hypothetical protein
MQNCVSTFLCRTAHAHFYVDDRRRTVKIGDNTERGRTAVPNCSTVPTACACVDLRGMALQEKGEDRGDT